MSKGNLIFLIFVALEIAVMIMVGKMIGALYVVLWFVAMIFLGLVIIARTIRAIGEYGYITTSSIFVRLTAALLLMIPGFISDFMALLLMLLPNFNLKLSSKVAHGLADNPFVGKFFIHKFGARYVFSQNQEGSASAPDDNDAPYGQPSRPEQPKSDLQKAREHFQSKRPVIDADYESVPEDDDKNGKSN